MIKWNQQKEMKSSYIIMRLDFMMQKHQSIGLVDLEELHSFIAEFRLLDRKRQKQYAWMIDEVANLWDAFDEVDY
jgi:hypothetical protein